MVDFQFQGSSLSHPAFEEDEKVFFFLSSSFFNRTVGSPSPLSSSPRFPQLNLSFTFRDFDTYLSRTSSREGILENLFFSQKNIILRKSEIQELDASYEKASSMQQENMQMIRKRLLSYILLLRIRYRQLTFHSFIFLERDN